ncbi:MAG: glycosyltransferase family 4 protein [Spirulinaceae cyanobacterium RM2_2_10]|nr:glycosyltransferase family 4 protein [Spirulinaceae cyanobacterium SM2_1_0]NJO20586.1 glycosyltransferase family 4 protein [Spirulinaceae cyanobacterium RM2_2_10]
MTTRKRIALYYPNFAGGGAEAVGLWILEALKDDYDLSLFTLTPVDLAKLDRMYGTQLMGVGVKVQSVCPPPLTGIAKVAIANSAVGRYISLHWPLRRLKAEHADYDLAISGYNAADLGAPGIQYVHWVGVVDNIVRKQPIYGRIADFDPARLLENWSLANSQFVAERFHKDYGKTARVVYPPVVMDVQDIPWEAKDDAFICSGRLVKAKSPHKAIQILSRVRQQGYDVKLHLTGGGGGTYAWQYGRFLRQMVARNADWVTLHENLNYRDYVKLLATCRYGIHHKPEPFGISIAEMVKAGAIPFVRSRGGQVEIVGIENEALFFDGIDQAVEKIVAVLGDRQRLDDLRTQLTARNQLFSTERFMTEIRQAVAEFFATPAPVQA